MSLCLVLRGMWHFLLLHLRFAGCFPSANVALLFFSGKGTDYWTFDLPCVGEVVGLQ
jgi:hypothetical protein